VKNRHEFLQRGRRDVRTILDDFIKVRIDAL
jgi:hypothetical protein